MRGQERAGRSVMVLGALLILSAILLGADYEMYQCPNAQVTRSVNFQNDYCLGEYETLTKSAGPADNDKRKSDHQVVADSSSDWFWMIRQGSSTLDPSGLDTIGAGSVQWRMPGSIGASDPESNKASLGVYNQTGGPIIDADLFGNQIFYFDTTTNVHKPEHLNQTGGGHVPDGQVGRAYTYTYQMKLGSRLIAPLWMARLVSGIAASDVLLVESLTFSDHGPSFDENSVEMGPQYFNLDGLADDLIHFHADGNFDDVHDVIQPYDPGDLQPYVAKWTQVLSVDGKDLETYRWAWRVCGTRYVAPPGAGYTYYWLDVELVIW